MTMIPFPYRTNRQRGFTLIELIMIIVILGILSATVYVRWPVGMEEAAAVKEFKRAVRYAQHKAMTRQFTTAAAAWGIKVDPHQYTLRRADGTESAEAEYAGRCLNNDCNTSITPAAPSVNTFVYFNALGEPIDTDGNPLAADTIFTITADGGGTKVTVRQRTGYVE